MVGACIQDNNDREGEIILDRYGPTWFIAHQPVFQPLHGDPSRQRLHTQLEACNRKGAAVNKSPRPFHSYSSPRKTHRARAAQAGIGMFAAGSVPLAGRSFTVWSRTASSG